MASITVVTVMYDNAQRNGFRYVRYEYTLQDNNSETSKHYVNKLIGPDVDAPQDALAGVDQILEDKVREEGTDFIHRSVEGEIILHVDAGGYYVHSEPAWATWEEQSTIWLKYWLGQEDQLDLTNMKLELDLFTNTELKDLLGIAQGDTSDIRAAVQVAVDTKATLDTYVPFMTNGVWTV